jgi:hypothetical protein
MLRSGVVLLVCLAACHPHCRDIALGTKLGTLDLPNPAISSAPCTNQHETAHKGPAENVLCCIRRPCADATPAMIAASACADPSVCAGVDCSPFSGGTMVSLDGRIYEAGNAEVTCDVFVLEGKVAATWSCARY